MDSGYYAALTGLAARMDALDVAANNLANVSTTGYRAQQEFYSSLAAGTRKSAAGSLNRAVNDYGSLGGAAVNLANGSLQQTGNEFDLAIEGAGFFAVQTKAGIRYTRNGNFRTDTSGYLVTAGADRVLGDQGPIQLTSDPVTVGEDGTITQGGAIVARLRIENFDPGRLSPEGSSMYAASGGAGQPVTEPVVRQGSLEASNMDPISATVRLILTQRQAQMFEQAFSIFSNDFDRTAAETISRV